MTHTVACTVISLPQETLFPSLTHRVPVWLELEKEDLCLHLLAWSFSPSQHRCRRSLLERVPLVHIRDRWVTSTNVGISLGLPVTGVQLCEEVIQEALHDVGHADDGDDSFPFSLPALSRAGSTCLMEDCGGCPHREI